MGCNKCGAAAKSVPAGLIADSVIGAARAIGKRVQFPGSVTNGVKNIVRGGSSKSHLITTGARSPPIANVRRSAPDVVHQGVRHGSIQAAPGPVQKYLNEDVLDKQLRNVFAKSKADTTAKIQAAFSPPPSLGAPVSPPPIHPALADIPRPDMLSTVQRRATEIYRQPVLKTPDKAIGKPFAFRDPEAAVEFQGAAGAIKKMTDDLAETISREQRALSDTEVSALSVAMKQLDDAGAKFMRAPAQDAAALARDVAAARSITISQLDDPVAAALRQADDPLTNMARRGDDYGDVVAHSDYARPQLLPGEMVAGERMVVDEFGTPLMQKTIRMADGSDHYIYRELTESEARQFSSTVTREVSAGPEALVRTGTDGIGGIAAKGTSLYKTTAMLGGAAIVGGVAAKMLLSPASAMPLGEDLAAYQAAVCDPTSQYYDEQSCAAITRVNDLLRVYPESWGEVCVEGSPIYDPEMCVVIQGLIAAAQQGVPYQGGTPEDYGGTTQMIDQATIDELMQQYCHPASPDYSEEACAKIKALAEKYGFSVTEPGGSSGGGGSGGGGSEPAKEEPPWDELTPEEIHAIVCDRYGNWYSPKLCKEYTEYLRKSQEPTAPGDDVQDVESPGETTDPGYLPGGGVYPGAGGSFDGGWYGGAGGGVQYYDAEESTPVCPLEDVTCIGWFQYGTEWFFWDGEEFYDSYGNLVYFVWTDADQADYEAALNQATPDGGLNLTGGELY